MKVLEGDGALDQFLERARVQERAPDPIDLVPAESSEPRAKAPPGQEPERIELQVTAEIEAQPFIDEPIDFHVGVVGVGGEPRRVDRADRGSGEDLEGRAGERLCV